MKIKKKLDKLPPKKLIQSVQYDLFSQFVSNNQNDVSNTVEVWESIPKYFFTTKQTEKLRTETGHADPFKWDYCYKGISCTVKIQPALVEQDSGGYKAFFPGITEELVEEALKKILADQHYGLHDPQNPETWVRFSLSMLHKELKIRGRSRSRNEIKHSIEVMSSCIITLFKEEKEVWKGAILQDLVTVGRDDYLADTNSHHVARLPLFISNAINQLDYRQFNYDCLMSCNGQLTRWIHKQLVHKFPQAGMMNSYHFMHSNLKRDSGLLQQGRNIDNRRKVIEALDELINHDVLMNYSIDSRKEGRKIMDIKYTLRASPNFVKDQKASNKKYSDSYRKALEANIKVIDKRSSRHEQ